MFWAHVQMLSRLEAERRLADQTSLLAAGDRSLEDRDRSQYVAELERSANGGKRQREKPTLREVVAAQAQMAVGIQIFDEHGKEVTG